MTTNACCADISSTRPPALVRLRLGSMNDMEVLDEPNDVADIKRASEETEAEGAPDPKFAKFDDGACLCVCM